jgi:hypothetical protein
VERLGCAQYFLQLLQGIALLTNQSPKVITGVDEQYTIDIELRGGSMVGRESATLAEGVCVNEPYCGSTIPARIG